jgi:hypothetical protein
MRRQIEQAKDLPAPSGAAPPSRRIRPLRKGHFPIFQECLSRPPFKANRYAAAAQRFRPLPPSPREGN